MHITAPWLRSWGWQKMRKRFASVPGAIAVVGIALTALTCEAADDPLYTQHCVACHQAAGAGMPGIAPPLRSDALKKIEPDASVYVVQVLLRGMQGAAQDVFYAGVMPSWAHLSDAEIAAVANYVLKLNREKTSVTADKVAELRKISVKREELRAMRAAP